MVALQPKTIYPPIRPQTTSGQQDKQTSDITTNMPSVPSYRVIEPHPSVPNDTRPAIYHTRGGAGNVVNLENTPITDSQTATGPASLTRLDSRVPSAFTSGRGGAGNVHGPSERAIFSFDEELEREMRRVAPVYHVGRGGAGNMIYSGDSRTARDRDTYSLYRKTSAGSSSSTESTAGKALRTLEKGWGKLTGKSVS